MVDLRGTGARVAGGPTLSRESKVKKRTEPGNLVLMGDASGRTFIGCAAIPGRLPALWRMPGETPAMFAARCRSYLTPGPDVVGQLVYGDEVQASALAAAPPQRYFH
jgi:hypothetical protein